MMSPKPPERDRYEDSNQFVPILGHLFTNSFPCRNVNPPKVNPVEISVKNETHPVVGVEGPIKSPNQEKSLFAPAKHHMTPPEPTSFVTDA